MMQSSANVVVIGGGVIGTSTAMHLARMGAGKVLLLEKNHLASGASGRSGAMVREHYPNPILVRMAIEASAVFHNFQDAVGGDARFIETGRLQLFDDFDAAAARANVAMNRELGVDIRLVDLSDIQDIVPNVSLDGVTLGVYEPTSGYADPMATTYAFAEQAMDHGAEIRTECAVTGIKTAGGRVVAVETEAGDIETEAVVAATGPWTNKLAAPLGEPIPITPTRVQLVHLRRPPSLESMTTIIIDHTTGSYLRASPGPNTLLGGEAPGDLDEVVNPDSFGLNADHGVITRFWERAKRRFPDFRMATPLGGYGSLYDLTPDGNPVLDRSEAVDGLYWATGFSGHGFKLSPVIGRMMAELVLHGDSSGHPIRAFRGSRFREGDLLLPEHSYAGRAHP